MDPLIKSQLLYQLSYTPAPFRRTRHAAGACRERCTYQSADALSTRGTNPGRRMTAGFAIRAKLRRSVAFAHEKVLEVVDERCRRGGRAHFPRSAGAPSCRSSPDQVGN